MIRRRFRYRQTITTILAEREGEISAAIDAMLDARREIEYQILEDPFFLSTFEPYVPEEASPAVTRMVNAACDAGVGPMAAVAGTIAWAGAEAMREAGALTGVVDNGGDIALFSDRPLVVGLHAGDAPPSNRLAFRVPPQEEILGICTSSASVGPSINLGAADSVTVFSRDVSCADAWATSICNITTAEGIPELELSSTVCGVFAIIGDKMYRIGKIPPLVRARVDESLITAGDRIQNSSDSSM
ncbi:MAG: UPF0280 family protein [Methanoculleaceae archaeon]